MKGFTLLEVMIGIFIGTIGLCGLMEVTVHALHLMEEAAYDQGF